MDPIRKTEEGQVQILEVSGSLQHVDTPGFEEALEKIMQDGARFIVLDFTGLRYICSSALGVMIASKRKIRRREGDIRLVVQDGDVARVFRITLLDRVFQFHETKQAAVSAFNQTSS